MLIKGNTGPDGSVLPPPAEIQRAALDLLLDHLAYESPYFEHKTYWPIGLMNLRAATVTDAVFSAIKVDTVHFRDTQFCGGADFAGCDIVGADFAGVTFDGPANFADSTLGTAVFTDAVFKGPADFTAATFTLNAKFADTTFVQPPDFTGARVAAVGRDGTVLPPGWQVTPGADPAWLSITADPVRAVARPGHSRPLAHWARRALGRR